MKKLFTITAVLMLSISIFAQKKAINEIDQFITSWHEAAASNDQDEYFNCIDETGIYIGTDSTEVWTKNEFYEWSTPHFEKKKGWNFKANSRNIYISDDKKMAWFDELINYGKGTLRGSGILIKRGEDWRILHYVLSVPVPNEKFNDVMKKINSQSLMIEK